MDVLGQVSVCASVFMIVALSYERHFAICSPHAYRIHLRTVARWKHLMVYVVPVIIASIFVNIPKIINLKVTVIEKYDKCNDKQRFTAGNDEKCDVCQSQFVPSVLTPADHHWMVAHFSTGFSKHQN